MDDARRPRRDCNHAHGSTLELGPVACACRPSGYFSQLGVSCWRNSRRRALARGAGRVRDFRRLASESLSGVWTPLRPSTRGEGQGFNYVIVGRLRPGVTSAQAEADIASAGQFILQQRRFRPGANVRYSLMGLREATTTTSLAGSSWMVLAVTVLVLVIGCV